MASEMYVKRISEKAALPIKHNEHDAAYDLSSIEDVSIAPGKSAIVRTGLSIQVPRGTYGQIAPRSGLSVKGVFVNAGVIDRGYTGEVKVILFNFGEETVSLPESSRIAQLIVKKIDSPAVVEVDTLTPVDARSEGGFGSTGLGLRQVRA